MKKIFIKLAIPLIFGMAVLFAACTEREPEDLIPPVQDIITEDPDSTMGWVTVNVLRRKNGKNEYAPAGTEVYLYLNQQDLNWDYDNDKNFRLSFYRFMTTNSNVIEMGYLPKTSYYIRAIYDDYTYYEAISPVLVRQRNETITLTMEQAPRPPILSSKKK